MGVGLYTAAHAAEVVPQRFFDMFPPGEDQAAGRPTW